MLIGRVRTLHRYPVKSMAGESLARLDVGTGGVIGDRAYALRDNTARELRSARKWPRLMLAEARYATEPTRVHTPAALITLPDGTRTRTDEPDVSQRLSRWLEADATLFPIVPASEKEHYRRASPGSSVAGLIAQSPRLRKLVARAATVGPFGAELRSEFGREAHEPLPDLSQFEADIYQYVSPPGTYFDAFPIHLITSASLDAMRSAHPESDWDARRFRANFVIDTEAEFSGLVENAWAGRCLRLGDVEISCTIPTPRCSMPTQPQPGLRKDASVLRAIVRDAAQNLGMYARVTRGGAVKTGDLVELV